MPVVPDRSRPALVERFGAGAADWCDRFPSMVEQLGAEWGLTFDEALPGGATSVVLAVHDRQGVDGVLKLTPDVELARGEATALGRWAGSPSSVQLLRADLGRGALLLERLRPGRPLTEVGGWSLDDIAALLRDLWRPTPVALPPLAERVRFVFELYRRRAAAIDCPPLAALDRGEAAALELAASGGTIGLVHGDLHAGNVLVADRGLVAIDPRPVIGDIASDAVDWALHGATSRAELIGNARSIAAGAPPVDADRIVAWCEAYAVVLAISSIRRGGRARAAQLMALGV